ncbi:MAG: hypothetical protein ACOCX4_01440 [Planctomycetota bacterium]
MECPLCGSRALIRDYAPPRPYAFLLFGGFLLVLGRLVLPGIRPGLFVPGFDAVFPRLYYAGIAACLLGGFDLFINETRYCVACGFRGRFPRKRMDAKTAAAVAEFRKERPVEARKAAKQPPVGTGQSVGPLIRMLRMKDPSMRADAAATLREVTGQDFGEDADAWDAWWAEHKDTFRAGRAREGEG